MSELTLDQVQEALAKVAVHLGQGAATTILRNSGGVELARSTKADGTPAPDESIASGAARMKPKKFGRVIRKCEIVLAKQAADAKKKADEIEAARAEREAMEKPLAEIETLGKEIAARVKLMHKYEAAAEDKAKVEIKNAQDQRDSITKMLTDAKEKCKAAKVSFKKFQATYCPELGRTRLYELLAIGSGKKTQEEVRADTAKRTAKSRASEAERERVIGAANAAMAAVTGNGADDEASTEARKAEMEKLAILDELGIKPNRLSDAYHAKFPQYKGGTLGPAIELAMAVSLRSRINPGALVSHTCKEVVISLAEMPAEDASDDALTCFKAMVAALCPFMADVSEARKFLSNEKLWRPKTPVRKAA